MLPSAVATGATSRRATASIVFVVNSIFLSMTFITLLFFLHFDFAVLPITVPHPWHLDLTVPSRVVIPAASVKSSHSPYLFLKFAISVGIFQARSGGMREVRQQRQRKKICAGRSGYDAAVSVKDGGCGGLSGGDSRAGFSSGWANSGWVGEREVAG
ncbi:hypothetical protein NL676_020684 [Syzygium grande]|nr:hypothetical protein NL676_020684 [Syzygium grande]